MPVVFLCILIFVIKQKKVGSGDNIIAAFEHSICTVAESPTSGAEAFWTDASGLRWTFISTSSAGMKTTMFFLEGSDGGYDVMVSACYGFVRYCGISIIVIIILIIAAALFTMLAKIATAIICKFTDFPA